MKGKLKIIEKKDEKLVLEFSNVPYYYINAIRRYTIGKVPVFAIDNIIVYENKTSFFDEYIAHRIGMIPIKVEGEVEGEIGFVLDEQGPKVIYSSSLKSNKDNVKVALENIPIITLREGQSLRIEGRVKQDIGREHAKFQSGISSFEIQEEKGDLVSGKLFIETLYHFTALELFNKVIEEIEKDLKDFSDSLTKEIKAVKG